MPKTIWFAVDDLLDFMRANSRPSGIQRLSYEIYNVVQQVADDAHRIRFVRQGPGPRSLVIVEWEHVVEAFDELVRVTPRAPDRSRAEKVRTAPVDTPIPDPGAAPPPQGRLRRAGRTALRRLPDTIRKPLVRGSVMQAQAAFEAGVATASLAAWPLVRAVTSVRAVRVPWFRRGAIPIEDIPADPEVFTDECRPGDVFVVLGSPWHHENYGSLLRWLRDERRIRVCVFMHDTIPAHRPEWCHHGVVRTYRAWHDMVHPQCDLVIANSQSTAADVERYARDRSITFPQPVRVLPIGTGFGGGLRKADERPSWLPEAGSYVLFVSTLEARKNHIFLFRLWRRLIEERGPDDVPDLVFAGRVGWLVEDLVQQLENTRWLNGKITMVRDPSDVELSSLYDGCLFTIFPSLYEGWGLPVTESLAMGKPCLCSNRAALPEAGGHLARYFDPESLTSGVEAITPLLDDPASVAVWEARVRAEFKPIPWTRTAEALLAMLDDLERPPATVSRAS